MIVLRVVILLEISMRMLNREHHPPSRLKNVTKVSEQSLPLSDVVKRQRTNDTVEDVGIELEITTEVRLEKVGVRGPVSRICEHLVTHVKPNKGCSTISEFTGEVTRSTPGVENAVFRYIRKQ
ncbi:hypothetical protein HAPAU_37260 [Halalkalicoccus paucihalophilus]|uniref:Uncharacterized protein n=1 Tax=Halalkalicoccus paucihalophilus TaxID=1008153 RepID=A0A151A9E3_9EURY|nr:hypothetical protein [Halalkalicoccus paucihalophilus]KYH24255.1 hypothetical protein HAPAU_37260 [Halalkalicoccus paucihalophilus]